MGDRKLVECSEYEWRDGARSVFSFCYLLYNAVSRLYNSAPTNTKIAKTMGPRYTIAKLLFMSRVGFGVGFGV